MGRLSLWWDALRSSLWFVPSLIVGAMVLLAIGLIELDVTWDSGMLDRFPRLFGAGAEGARGMLQAIASATITVAGVVFSITIVALSLASNQYTSRVLRNFLRDPSNQTALGTFVGTYAYCLIVLRTIRAGDVNGFVPSVAVLSAVCLAVVGIVLLIHFIHHISTSLQASRVLAGIYDETSLTVDRLYPKDPKTSSFEAPGVAELSCVTWYAIRASSGGYVQGIDSAALVRLARKHCVVLRLRCRPGDFLMAHDHLAYRSGAECNPEVNDGVRRAVTLAEQRTMKQDVAFGLRQLVDVALKALSPGVNDPTTAVMCIDRLAALVAEIGVRGTPSSYIYNGGALRVIATTQTFEEMLDLAFSEIRHAARDQPVVLARLVDALAMLAARDLTADRQEAVLSHLGHMWGAISTVGDRPWRDRLRRTLQAVHSGRAPGPSPDQKNTTHQCTIGAQKPGVPL